MWLIIFYVVIRVHVLVLKFSHNVLLRFILCVDLVDSVKSDQKTIKLKIKTMLLLTWWIRCRISLNACAEGVVDFLP